ncbi:MAG: TonB-dependent receptor [Bacteroidota bacterium]|nr:TonB-dependent receptor [Bacteroidota bacterium]
MRLLIIIVVSFLLFSNVLSGQNTGKWVKGKVVEIHEDGHQHELIGANVYWKDTYTGTTTNMNGEFRLKRLEENPWLVISYTGFLNDTLDVSETTEILIALKETIELDEVEFVFRQKSTTLGLLDPLKVEKISDKELLKAACCNLSESFETNPSVDVSFTDAVTGTRQIMMLGLAGPYTQITRENMPDIRGFSSIYGLTYIPGPWVEAIHLNKGTGSVVNGYESIAGQINVNLRNPASMDKLYVNSYANESGRLEANVNYGADVGKIMGTALLLHASTLSTINDRNDDGFLDKPLGNQLIALNRWELYSDNGLHFQVGVKGTYIDKTGGQVSFYPEQDIGTTNAWGMELDVKRVEAWTKLGKVNIDKPWQSVGWQLSGAVHEQKSWFGLNQYDALQNTLYTNFIFQSIINNTNHKFKTGISMQYDDYEESLNGTNYDRLEFVPGAFFEYSYNHLDKFGLVAGFRYDYHNLFGSFVTPRLHMRYAITEKSVLRFSSGRGLRTANIISENNGILASSRQILVVGNDSDKPYGLDQEIAWNFGLNFTQKFILDYRHGFVSFDFYRTEFINQIVVDLDKNPQEVSFYNLNGKSYSNSFQAQLDYELIKRLDLRLAYRWYDVKTSYGGELREKPLVSNHRAFINAGYETMKHWKFDFTVNWQGRKRIPDTRLNPEAYRLDEYSPDFVMLNAQISKTWWEKFEAYAGVENLLNYKQENPILSADQPFGTYFDSSMIWGPLFGRNIYVGLRYKIR